MLFVITGGLGLIVNHARQLENLKITKEQKKKTSDMGDTWTLKMLPHY